MRRFHRPQANGNAPPASRLRPLALLVAAGLLTACAAVGPNYQGPPPVEVGSGWTLPLASASQSADLSHWWSALDDPILDRLMATALAQNLDLRQAAARTDEARALRDRVAGEALPTVGAGASVNRRGQSENGPLPVGRIPGLDATQTIYDAGFDAAWELDLFGAKRRALESASARLQATEAEAQGVRMRLVAEVARTWFAAVGARYELHAQQATLDTLLQTFELVRLRHALGDASAADVEAAYAQWAAVNALLPDIEARQRAAVLGLGVLLGSPPERELALLDGPLTPSTLLALPVGERADMLRRRPDVLAAERRLAASSADIGVATAELFPKLSIGVGGGFQALSTGDWFDASSSRFSILPLISWRLFDGGRVRAEIRAREAGQQQAALAYEQAVLAALGDAERALGDYHGGLDTLERESLQVGCISSTRRFFPSGKLTRAKWQSAFNEVAAEYQQFAARFRGIGWQETLGSSGTNKAIGEMCAAMGLTKGAVTAEALPVLRERLIEAGHINALDLPGLSEDRRPVIAGGLLALEAAFAVLGLERMAISKAAMREGVLYDMLGRGGEHDPREAAIQALTQRYGIDVAQAARVHATSLQLFDQVAGDWQLGPDDRLMLGWAARLHEIGLTIAHSQHHVHGAYILAHSDIPGFSQQEQRFLAALVQTHRRKVSRSVFDVLPDRLIDAALRLGILLRLAVVLHHSGEDEALPLPTLTASGPTLRLQIDPDWLEAHPLLRADLEGEPDAIQGLGIQLQLG